MLDVSSPTAVDLDQASKNQSSQGLLVQSYCNSVIAQTPVDLGEFKNLEKYQEGVNQGLNTAKGHAQDYLMNIQPLIITSVNSISNYYGLYDAVATTLTPGSSMKDWMDALNAMQDQSGQYKKDADLVVSRLKALNIDLGNDTASFAKIVSDLNIAVNGDNGVLQSIDGQLGTMQSKIDGAISGVALSGFAIMGGIFMIVVGAVADFVTAGTSTPLIIAGIGVVAAGIGGEVASAITLKNLNDEKNNLLMKKSSLTAEVNLALGMSSAYGSLKNQALAATNAASQMSNAWGSLSGDIGNLITNLEKGKDNDGFMRQVFLRNANTTIPKILTDTDIIKKQMAGVVSLQAPKGKRVGDFTVEVAENYQQYKQAA